MNYNRLMDHATRLAAQSAGLDYTHESSLRNMRHGLEQALSLILSEAPSPEMVKDGFDAKNQFVGNSEVRTWRAMAHRLARELGVKFEDQQFSESYRAIAEAAERSQLSPVAFNTHPPIDEHAKKFRLKTFNFQLEPRNKPE